MLDNHIELINTGLAQALEPLHELGHSTECGHPGLTSFAQIAGIADLRGLYKLINNYILSGGKRIRPLTYLLVYEGYAGAETDLKKVLPGALALELMHNFALIHDDLIDRSITRRGHAALQVSFSSYLAENGRPSDSGPDLAILAGDIVYSLALENCLKLEPELPNRDAAIHELLSTAVRTGCGAFNEIWLRSGSGVLGEEEILRLYNEKTANYSFACPLKMGALLAGADCTEINKLGEFARLVGQAYQIYDDIKDMKAIIINLPTAHSTHLRELRTMLPYHYLYSTGSDRDRKIMSCALRGETSLHRKFMEILDKSPACDMASVQAEDLLNTAREIFDSLKTNQTVAERINSLLLKFFNAETSAV